MSQEKGEFPTPRRRLTPTADQEWDEVERALAGHRRTYPPGGVPDHDTAERMRRRLAYTAKRQGGELRTALIRTDGRWQVVFERREQGQ